MQGGVKYSWCLGTANANYLKTKIIVTNKAPGETLPTVTN